MKIDEKELSKIEQKTKLNWFEKKALKTMIKKAKKKIKLLQKEFAEEQKLREIMETELLSFNDVLEIELDSGELLDTQNIKKLTNQEIEDAFNMSIEEMEKLL